MSRKVFGLLDRKSTSYSASPFDCFEQEETSTAQIYVKLRIANPSSELADALDFVPNVQLVTSIRRPVFD